MTCAVAATGHAFDSIINLTWPSMSPDPTHPRIALERQLSHGYASSESETKKAAGSSGKKRASRAGTRSVNTLSAAQLERKRANDREAQRAIRQRTKDHIDTLETSINELRGREEANQRIIAQTQQRNRELEQENAYLRSKSGEAGYPLNLPVAEDSRPQDPALLSMQSAPSNMPAAGASIYRPGSTAAPQSRPRTSRSPDPHHAAYQQQRGFTPAVTAPMNDPSAGVTTGPMLSTWRPHNSSHSVHGLASSHLQVQENAHEHAALYAQSHHSDRNDWQPTQQTYHYSMTPEQQQQAHHQQQHAQQQQQQHAPQQQPQQQQQQQHPQYHPNSPPHGAVPPPPSVQQASPQQYVQSGVQSYTSTPAQHQSYQPPQHEFQNMAVSSPASYQMAPQHSYLPPPPLPPPPQGSVQPPTYQVTPLQQVSSAGAEYVSTPGHMQQAPLLPAPTYHMAPGEAQYAAQHTSSPMAYREDNRSYPMAHYSSA